jgi:hypothetical protein
LTVPVERHRLAVMLVLDTADPRLSYKAIEEAMQTPGGVDKLRRVILQHLPKDVARVAAAFPVEHAKLLMDLHLAFGEDIRKELGVRGQGFVRPPPGYVPPTTE